MNEHQKIVFVNKINMNKDQSALQMISHGTGIPSKILSYGWEWIEVLRFTEGIWWDGICTMKHFPTPITGLTLCWKPFFPVLFPCDSYTYEQQACLSFTLNFPGQPPVEMYRANNRMRVARCSQQCHQCPFCFPKKNHSPGNGSAPDIYTVNLTPHSAIYCYIFLWAGMQVHTMMVTPADAGTPVWLCLGHWSQSFPPMNKPQNKYSKPRSNLIFVSKLLTEAFLTTNPNLNSNKLSKECRIDTSFLHSNSPVLALQQLTLHCWKQQKHWVAIPSHWAKHAKTLQRKMCVQ